VGFIGHRIPGIIYKPMDIECDRLAAVQILSKGQVILTVIGVYFPFHREKKEQIQHYSDTVDVLQSILDNVHGPCIVVGDMNAPLPQQQTLTRYWYRQHPFNSHSYLLHDFLCTNNLQAANFNFVQKVKYTYSDARSRSYIDHVLVPHHVAGKVTDCTIMCDIDINTSDHFPLMTTITTETNENSKIPSKENKHYLPVYPKMNWEDKEMCHVYKEIVAEAAQKIQTVNINNIHEKHEARNVVESLFDSICDVLHSSCSKALSEKQVQGRGKRKGKNWWNLDCTVAKDKQRFWFKIWNSCERPREGQVYKCYKAAKKAYRDTCKTAMNSKARQWTNNINSLHRTGNLRKFWNLIKSSRRTVPYDDIDISALHRHFEDKFCGNNSESYNSVIRTEARQVVKDKYNKLSSKTFNDKVISTSMIKQYISSLHSGCSPGLDGIMAEHLKYASESKIPQILSNMLTLCIKFGIIPKAFCRGLLVPILKKNTLDPSIPKNYRPVTVSSILSKILEHYILECSGHHVFSDTQFGFVQGRGTCMAVSLSNDVINYCIKHGSPVYTCSLDAQGAFDEVPHEILFMKANNIVPDHCWTLLVSWYQSMYVELKWANQLSQPIKVSKGTRQGGLSSPFLFNIFYQDLINKLNECTGGLRINKDAYNVIAYADDLLLCSLTVTGLQNMINVANKFIEDHGLAFNPLKTECCIFGKCTLQPNPEWTLEQAVLQVSDQVRYLGVNLSSARSDAHIYDRMNKTKKAFYSLKNAGLFNTYNHPDTVSYLYRTAIRPILTYGLNCLNLNARNWQEIEKCQSGIVKSALHLHKYSRSSPVLKAMNICRVKYVIELSTLDLAKAVLSNTSKARSFYMHFLQRNIHNNLMTRSLIYSKKYNINFLRYVCDDRYASNTKLRIRQQAQGVQDGLSDSVRYLLNGASKDRTVLNLLLTPF
jgi:hypothetical protein